MPTENHNFKAHFSSSIILLQKSSMMLFAFFLLLPQPLETHVKKRPLSVCIMLNFFLIFFIVSPFVNTDRMLINLSILVYAADKKSVSVIPTAKRNVSSVFNVTLLGSLS